MNRAIIALALAALAAILMGAAGDPLPVGGTNELLNRIRPGVPRHSSALVLDANTTTSFFPVQSGSSVVACYPDRATVVVTARNLAATCCLTLANSGITLGDQTTGAAVVVTDANGPDGNGACKTLPAGGEWHATIDVRSLRSNYGGRSGVCSAPTIGTNAVTGYQPRVPCRVDTDCTSAGGAAAGTTCITAPSEDDWQNACAAIACKAPAASTFVGVTMAH